MAKLSNYNGTVELADGLRPKNNGSFPLMEARDIVVSESGKRLDALLEELSVGIPDVVQTTGDSEDKVMSQKAVTDELVERTEMDESYFKDISDTLTIEFGYFYSKEKKKYVGAAAEACCGLIPVKEGDRLKISTTYGYYRIFIAEFNEDKEFFRYKNHNDADYVEDYVYVTDYEYTVPSGVHYIGINNVTQGSRPMVVYKYVPKPIKAQVEDNKESIENLKPTIFNGADNVEAKADKSFVYDYSTAIGLVIDLLKKGTYNEDVSRTIEALENSVYPNGIKLTNSLAEGTYTLKYEYVYEKDDEEVVVLFTDWLDICTFTITSSEQRLVYREFIAENAPPKTANKIGIYDATGERVGYIELGWLNRFMYQWNLNYSFAVISDVHIGKGDSEEDLINATAYFDDNNIDFAVICGDAVDDGSSLEELEAYQSIVAKVETPIYVAMGNHESVNLDISGRDNDISGNYASISQYFKQNAHPNINQELYYTFNKGNDVFIILGVYGNFNYGRTFSAAELQWLYETLEANRNKRCFLFHHYFPKNGSGDAVNCYSSDGLKGTQGEVFYNLLRHYKNVIYFHGHSHASFRVQELNKYNTIDKEYGRYSVHVPSLMWTTYPNANGDAYVKDKDTGEGYIVEVYSTGVLLKGRDFEKNMFVPLGTYFLETTIQEVKENTFFDETGTIITG